MLHYDIIGDQLKKWSWYNYTRPIITSHDSTHACFQQKYIQASNKTMHMYMEIDLSLAS